MAAGLYIFTCKSEEQLGAQQYNGLRVWLPGGDDDASTFADNLESIGSLDVVTTNLELTHNNALPYPEGSDTVIRLELMSALMQWYTQQIYDFDSTKSPVALAADLKTAGLKLPIVGEPDVQSINALPFFPTQFLF